MLDAGPPAALPPGRPEAEGDRRLGRASATSSASTATGRTSARSATNENALWSLGVHDLSVLLYLIDEEPVEALRRTATPSSAPGVEDVVFCYLRFPSGKIAHMHLSWLDPHKMRRITVVGRDKMAVFDDMERERKVTVYDKAPWSRHTYGEWRTRTVTSTARRCRCDRAAPPRVPALPAPRRRARATRTRPRDGCDSSSSARSISCRPRWKPSQLEELEVAETAIVYPGTVLGDGCKILDYAVVGKQPTLGPRSTAKQEELPPLELGAGTVVSTGAIVFAGTRIGARVIIGDQACVRERCDVGDDVVIGRGSLVENDTTVGDRDEDPGRRLRDGVLDPRGGRLHRAVR